MIQPTKPSVITLFCGGGLKSEGARQAGCELVGAIEYDEAIAGCEHGNPF